VTAAHHVFAFDTETTLISDGMSAPSMVCLTYATAHPGVTAAQVAELCQRVRRGEFNAQALLWGPPSEGIAWGLDAPAQGLSRLAQHLALPDTLVVGHNAAFDLLLAAEERAGMREAVIAATDAGRVTCTLVRDQMIDIANGLFRCRVEIDEETGEETFRSIGYHLTDLTDRRLGFKLDKGEDSWRLKYSHLAGTPPEQWPYEAVQYAVLDALSTLAVYRHQAAEWDPIPDEARQVKASLALSAVAGRGLCVNPPAVEALYQSILGEVVATRADLTQAGIYRPDGTKDTAGLRERVQLAYNAKGKPVPMTEPDGDSAPQVSTSRLTLVESGDPILKRLADVGAKERILTSFIPQLRSGYHAPIVCRYHPLVETGRTSCVNPNVQQLPKFPGVRDCFIPREGYYFVSCDYDTLELRTLAQVCLDLVGWSRMAELLQNDPDYDLHSDFAAEFEGHGTTYESFRARLASKDGAVKKRAKSLRNRAKAANFGYPGGLGPRTFQKYAKAIYQLDLDLDECEALRTTWKRKWPEVPEYQAMVGRALDPVTNEATFSLVQTRFVRGACGYTQGCNTQFQGLAAAGAKAALWRVYTDGPAHNVYPVAFVHDEIIAEVPIDAAHESAYWLADTMIREMQTVVPDVPIRCSPALMTEWNKAAEPKHDANGRLIPWTPDP
jgi:hypothetical protein